MGVQAHALIDATQHVLELREVLQRGFLSVPHDSLNLLHCLPSRAANPPGRWAVLLGLRNGEGGEGA